MAPKPFKTTQLDPDAHKRLGVLQTQLGSQSLPRDVDFIDILSALVIYTSPPQVAGMLRAYWDYIDERTEAETQGHALPTPPSWMP